MTNKANWKLEKNLPPQMAEAAMQVFAGISHSSAMDIGSDYDAKGPKDGWWDGTRIGEVTANNQFGEECTWDAYLQQAAGIMQSVHGFSKWRLRITGK